MEKKRYKLYCKKNVKYYEMTDSRKIIHYNSISISHCLFWSSGKKIRLMRKNYIHRAHDLANRTYERLFCDGDDSATSRKFLHIRHGTESEKIRSKHWATIQFESDLSAQNVRVLFQLSKRNLPYLYACLTIVEIQLCVPYRRAPRRDVAPDPG